MVILPLQEFYSAADLAEAMGVSTKTAIRRLRSARIRIIPRVPRAGSPVRLRYQALVQFAREWDEDLLPCL